MFPNPLTVDMVKDALRITSRKDDGELTRLIQETLRFLEDQTSRRFAERSEVFYMETLRECQIPVVPATVTKVEYTDDDTDAVEELSTADWYVSWAAAPWCSLRFKRDASLPSNVRPGTVKITCTVGAPTIDAAAIGAIVAIVGARFTNPEGTSPIQLYSTPQFRSLVQNLQVGPGAFA